MITDWVADICMLVCLLYLPVFAQSETDSVRHLREVTVTRCKAHSDRSTSRWVIDSKISYLNALQFLMP